MVLTVVRKMVEVVKEKKMIEELMKGFGSWCPSDENETVHNEVSWVSVSEYIYFVQYLYSHIHFVLGMGNPEQEYTDE